MSIFKRMTVLAWVCAVAVPLGVAGVGPAGAETVGPAEGKQGSATVQRSVSGDAVTSGRVTQGSTITVAAALDNPWGGLVSSVTDVHDTCLQAVPNTAVWTVSGNTYTNNPSLDHEQKPGEVTIEPGTLRIAGATAWTTGGGIGDGDDSGSSGTGSLDTGSLGSLFG